MAVKIRLKRFGRRHHPCYRIGVFDARSPRDGRAVEEIGTYDPRGKTIHEKLTLKAERLDYWLSVGAQPTESVAAIIKKLRKIR